MTLKIVFNYPMTQFADDTTLMAENEEELNSLLETEKVGLKLNKDIGGHLLAWFN